jgi:hypothetical protein
VLPETAAHARSGAVRSNLYSSYPALSFEFVEIEDVVELL